MPLAAGSQVAGFRIDSLIGRGGMGVVYRAFQLGLDRVVALKVIAPELLDDQDIRARFLAEARAAASVDHPNVIPVHEAGEADGVAYIAMRFVSGSDLRSLVRRGGALDPAEAAGFVAQAGAALDAIHRAGFVHRDIKPANLLVDPGGHVYLTDFGLAKQVLTRSSATRTGHWVGTLDYVSPEQIRGGRIDARADVYALGGVLHFALTGRVPFERHGDEAKLWAQLSAPPPVPSELRPELHAEFDAVVARAMAKHAQDRFLSAGDLGRAARAAASGTAPTEPERLVERGAAAPGAAPDEPGIAGEASTRTAQVRPPTGAIGPGRATQVTAKPRRRAPLIAVLAGVPAIAGIAVTLAVQGDEPDRAAGGRPTATARAATSSLTPTPTPTPTTTPAPAATAYATRTIEGIGTRPNGVALVGDELWVTSAGSEWITLVSARTGKELATHPKVGRDVRAIVTYRSAVWVALASANEVVRINPRSRRIVARLRVPGKPARLAVDRNGIWVGTAQLPGEQSLLLRYDRVTGRLRQTIPIAEGIDGMIAGGGRIWLIKAVSHKLARLEPGASRPVDWATLSGAAQTIRYARGALWITLQEEDALAKVDARSGRVITAYAGRAPAQAVVAGSRVFVASRNDHTVVTLDPETLRAVDEPIPVGLNPYAMVSDRLHVWVTGLADNTLTRVRYR